MFTVSRAQGQAFSRPRDNTQKLEAENLTVHDDEVRLLTDHWALVVQSIPAEQGNMITTGGFSTCSVRHPDC